MHHIIYHHLTFGKECGKKYVYFEKSALRWLWQCLKCNQTWQVWKKYLQNVRVRYNISMLAESNRYLLTRCRYVKGTFWYIPPHKIFLLCICDGVRCHRQYMNAAQPFTVIKPTGTDVCVCVQGASETCTAQLVSGTERGWNPWISFLSLSWSLSHWRLFWQSDTP